MYDIYVSPAGELYHHGIKGMKWGVRRYQNPDGSLTDEGRKRYLKGKSRYNYESAKTRKLGQKYGTDSYQYRKSSELDEKVASEYRKQGALGSAASVIAPTEWNTYQLSRATGRGPVESFLRSQLDLNLNTLLSMTSVAGGAAIGGAVASISAKRGLNKLLEVPASELANMFTYVPGVGTVNMATEVGKKAAKKAVVESSIQKGVDVSTAAGRGLQGAAIAGQNIAASRGREISAQQAWLRNNYINKGSVQEQRTRKEAEREERRRLKSK